MCKNQKTKKEKGGNSLKTNNRPFYTKQGDKNT